MANNRIVHFEIPANQPEVLAAFYGTLFGWKVQKAPIPGPEYWLVDTGVGLGINGAIMQRQHPQQPWMNYVDVPSIDAALEKAKELGAEIATAQNTRAGRRRVCRHQRPARQHLRSLGASEQVSSIADREVSHGARPTSGVSVATVIQAPHAGLSRSTHPQDQKPQFTKKAHPRRRAFSVLDVMVPEED